MTYPISSIVGFDHVDLRVRDILSVWQVWQDLGFKIESPSINHTEGIASCAIAFKDGTYIAMSGPVMQGEKLRSTVDVGVNSALLQVNDRDQAVVEAKAAGLTIKESFQFSRDIDVDGKAQTLTFKLASVCIADAPSDEEIMLIEHVTPELIWRDGMMEHNNDAQGVREVVLESSDLARLSKIYSKLVGDTNVTLDGDTLTIRCGQTTIVYKTPGTIDFASGVQTDGRAGHVVVYGCKTPTVTSLPGHAGQLELTK